MKDLFSYAEELAKTTRYGKTDLMNAISTLREMKVSEENIAQFIETAHRHRMGGPLTSIVYLFFHEEITERQHWKMELLCSLAKANS